VRAAVGPFDRAGDVHAGGNAQLVEEVAHVRRDRLRVQEELGGDLRVGPAFDDQPRHLQLTVRERPDASCARGARV
jgi:hypothetical protein